MTLKLAIGKRAGLTSGVLGMLCVLGELCFLLPDLLVTKDALPMYAANLGVFRALLGARIAATIALGLLGVALSRPNRRGLLGIGARDIAKSRQNSEYPQSVRRIAETR